MAGLCLHGRHFGRLLVAVVVLGGALAAPVSPPARAAETGPAAATLLVGTPQHAILAQSATDTRRIWIVRLLPEELVYKTADHADVETRLAARQGLKAGIKLLSGDVFRIDPRTGRFNRFDELTGRFAALHQGHADAERGGPAAGGHDGHGEIHVEVAEGTGTDPAAALADAFRNAVRQAVGVYVDSETLTDKEDVIADKVLTFSDAFVVRYDEISRTSDAGLVTIRISAAIQAGKLMTNLREAKVNTLDLAGADLVASALTRKEAKDAAAEMLFRKLSELPGTLAAEALPFKPLDYDARRETLTVTYTLHADRDKYLAFLQSVQPLLAQVAVAKTSIVLKVEPIWSDNSAPVWQDDSTKRRVVAAQGVFNPGFRYGPNLAAYPDAWCLWLMSRWDANHRNSQWQGYALDVELPRALRETRGRMEVRLDLVDAVGEAVRSETFDPLAELPRPAYWFGWTRPRPRQFLEKNPRTWPGLDDCPTRPILLTSFHDPELAVDRQRAVNVYVSPLCYAPQGSAPPLLTPGVWQVRQFTIDPETLAKVRSIRATPVFVPAAGARVDTDPSPSSSPSPAAADPSQKEPSR